MGDGELISAGAFSPSSIEQSLIKGKTERKRDRRDGEKERQREGGKERRNLSVPLSSWYGWKRNAQGRRMDKESFCPSLSPSLRSLCLSVSPSMRSILE
jgi:hypothetical protein